MSFDQNMIIDATTGSIARFVNHSCAPNCRMIKWIVSGQPRMALFAGDRPIVTGEELTYDYNFSPFSDDNVQKCLCGASNCRGILGPKPQEVKQPKPPKSTLKAVVKGAVKASKRKLDTLVGDENEAGSPAKKRKIKAAEGARHSFSAMTSLKTVSKAAAKGAATVKRRVSAMAILSGNAKTTPAKATPAKMAAKKATPKKSTPKKYAAPNPARKATAVRKSGTGKMLKTYGKGSPKKVSSRAPSMTIVAAGAGEDDVSPVKTPSSVAAKLHRSLSKASRNALEELSRDSTIRLVSPELVSPAATITARQD